MLKEVRSTMTFDKPTADALKALAEARTEGNKSLLVRELVREAAKLAGEGDSKTEVQHA